MVCGTLGGYGDALMLPPLPRNEESSDDAAAAAASAAAEWRAIVARAVRLTAGGGAMARRVVGLALLLARACAPRHVRCAALAAALGLGLVMSGRPALGLALELSAALATCDELLLVCLRIGRS